MTRNTMDEDWDERRDGGKDVPEYELQDFTKILLRNGKEHTSYYHYTNWDAFGKMMEEVKSGPARGLRMLLLSQAYNTNDRIERCWGRNVYLACFSYSRYEDVAMWMNYGKRSPDAVRIRFDGRKVRAWLERHRWGEGLFRAIPHNDGFGYERLNPNDVESVKLVDVAYVIPSCMTQGRLRGNVEYSRDFYRVFENGSMDWADSVYGGSCRLDLSPYFKKRGWCYERETRLVVTLREGVDLPERLAVRFCGPFDELERQMKGNGRERNLLSGPWFDDRLSSFVKVKGVGIREIGKSDYANEIKIITGCESCALMKTSGKTEPTKEQRTEVKVFACCDIHETKITDLNPTGRDIVLLAGDLQGYGCCSGPKPSPERIARQNKWVKEVFVPWCSKYPDVQFVVVAGNNDEFALEATSPLRMLPADSNIHYLQDSMIELYGLKIWGSPWVKPKTYRVGPLKPFERVAEDMRKAFAPMPDDIDILVTHVTPEVPGSIIAGDPQKKMGSEVLREVIEAKHPKVCVCGHIHASEHRPVRLGDTVVMNVSIIKDKDRFHAAYKPRIFTMTKDSYGQWQCEYNAADDMKI